jgi:hypothetical protein
MSFPARMRAIVGDENTVARYLLEKCGHTGLWAWVTVCLTLGLSLPPELRWWFARLFVVTAAIIALLYDVAGKVAWLRDARGRSLAKQIEVAQGSAPWEKVAPFLRPEGTPVQLWFEVRDFVFDLWVGLLAAGAATAILAWWWLPIAIAVWIAGVAIGSNNQWGSPS